MLVPDCSASLLLGMSAEWCRHFRVATVRHKIGSERLVIIIELLLVVVMGLLRHHVVLLILHLNSLCLIIVAIEISISRNMLWVSNKLMMLVEGREFHW